MQKNRCAAGSPKFRVQQAPASRSHVPRRKTAHRAHKVDPWNRLRCVWKLQHKHDTRDFRQWVLVSFTHSLSGRGSVWLAFQWQKRGAQKEIEMGSWILTWGATQVPQFASTFWFWGQRASEIFPESQSLKQVMSGVQWNRKRQPRAKMNERGILVSNQSRRHGQFCLQIWRMI
jgi:uncharacterized protein YndB with AHSA1/START domain